MRVGKMVLVLALLASGCVSGPPSCSDNPRNMQCMSADQIRKELAQ